MLKGKKKKACLKWLEKASKPKRLKNVDYLKVIEIIYARMLTQRMLSWPKIPEVFKLDGDWKQAYAVFRFWQSSGELMELRYILLKDIYSEIEGLVWHGTDTGRATATRSNITNSD